MRNLMNVIRAASRAPGRPKAGETLSEGRSTHATIGEST